MWVACIGGGFIAFVLVLYYFVFWLGCSLVLSFFRACSSWVLNSIECGSGSWLSISICSLVLA